MHPFDPPGVVGTARWKGDAGNRARPVAGESSDIDVAMRAAAPAGMRRAREQDLFEDHAPYRYHAIASNRSDEDAQATMERYSRRGDDSENRIKDLKIGFGMEYMLRGSFRANAAFFSIGALTYNLYLGFRSHALGSGREHSQVQTVRWRLFQTAGKIVRHGR
jgi:hypothetical protein